MIKKPKCYSVWLCFNREKNPCKASHQDHAIKTILNHLDFGIFVIDKNLIIQEYFSQSCLRYFCVDHLNGVKIIDLLQLSPRDASHYVSLVEQIFEDVLPEEVSLGQIPFRFQIQDQILKVEAKTIRGLENQVLSILYTVSDISALESAQKQSSLNKTLINLTKERDSFLFFIADVKSLLEEGFKALREGDQKTVKRNLHTIKGNAYSFELIEIVELIHHIEDSYLLNRKHLSLIYKAFKNFLETHYSVLEINFEDNNEDQFFTVNSKELLELSQIAESFDAAQALRIKKWMACISRKKVLTLLGPIQDFSSRLAERLGKKVKLEIKGGEILVDTKTMRPVIQSITHLIRNALDHGIEFSTKRGLKNEEGLVRVFINETDKNYIVSVSDDGQGIDTEKMSEAAVRKGLIDRKKIQKMTDEEKINLIYLDHLSLAQVTTDISGRGIGMSSVVHQVNKVNGTIQIKTEKGKGTEFIINVPKPDIFLDHEFSEISKVV